jgi:hypothetical protein
MLPAQKISPLAGLAVMFLANVLLCWYPLYQLTNYPAADKPDASVIAAIIALALTLATLLLLPYLGMKIWLHSKSLVRPKRTRTLVAALLMSLVSLAPLWYWVRLFARVRNYGG